MALDKAKRLLDYIRKPSLVEFDVARNLEKLADKIDGGETPLTPNLLVEHVKSPFLTKVSIVEAIRRIAENFHTIKGEKGDKGDPGPMGPKPELGIDYSIPEPIPGPPGASIEGRPGKDGRDGRDGKTPIPGVDFELPRDGKDAPPIDEAKIVKEVIALIPPPIPGEDGSPDTGDEIVHKINYESSDKIDASRIKNLPKVRGGGGGGGNRWIVGPSTNPGGTLTVSDTAPSNPAVGDLWVDIS